MIFAADRVVHPPPDDQHTIVVTKALRDSFIEGFDEDKEKAPTQAELTQMIDGWVASEILYREGKAMGVERGDDTIRDRIAFKLQLMIFNEINIPPATDVQLRQWFDVNRGRFDEPERVGFYITAPMSEANARAQLEAMRAGIESPEMRRQARAVLARPVDTLSASFGETFRESLLALPTGQWSVIQSREGWHLVRLDSHRPKQPAVFEEVRDSAERQYHTEETRKRAWEAVIRLKTKYTVRYE
ncbi:MAG: peptidyl-prolyl cis-trans isomerase [Rhodopila sp.]